MSLRAPSGDAIAAFVRAHETTPLSYPEVGATRAGLPAGYHVDRRKEIIGRGDQVFARARAAIDAWEMHRGAGVRVTPVEAPREGLTIALVVRAAGVYTRSACRVVYRVEETDRMGFAYGTLRDHPVAGEERFLVERAPNGDVTFELLAFSRPSSLVFRIAAPVTRRTQIALGGAYVEALRRAVTRP